MTFTHAQCYGGGNERIAEVLGQGAPVSAEAPVGRREAGKAARRRRIIRAARDLIRETGNAGLSMRALAARAGVSLATPYNLFGSKRAIVLAVLDDVRAFQTRFDALTLRDPLKRLFAAVNIAVEFYVADPRFYRTLWAGVFDVSDDLRTEIYSPERDAFSRQLVSALGVADILLPGIDPELLRKALDRSFAFAMLDWAMGELADEHLGPSVCFSHALILRGAARPEHQNALEAIARQSQSRLSARSSSAPHRS